MVTVVGCVVAVSIFLKLFLTKAQAHNVVLSIIKKCLTTQCTLVSLCFYWDTQFNSCFTVPA